MEIGRIGRFIAELRQAKGMTQKELAARLRVSDKTVSRWETGRGLPDPNSWQDLGQILGIGIDELLTGERCARTEIPSDFDRTLVETHQYIGRTAHRRSRPLIAGLAAILVVALAACAVGAYRLRQLLDPTTIEYKDRTYIQGTRAYAETDSEELDLYRDTGIRVKGMEVYDRKADEDPGLTSTVLLLKDARGSYLEYALSGGP